MSISQTRPHRPPFALIRDGFTLVELLIAIAIISLLVGMLIPAVNAAKKHAKKVVAITEIKGLETALKQYYQEYSKWPSFAGANEEEVRVTAAIAAILGGTYDATDNPKKLQFMQFGKVNGDGDPLAPWANPSAPAPTSSDFYYLKFDTDYSNKIEGTGDAMNPPETDIQRGVAVWAENPYVDAGHRKKIIGSWNN